MRSSLRAYVGKYIVALTTTNHAIANCLTSKTTIEPLKA
jgi:hypothetical protein